VYRNEISNMISSSQTLTSCSAGFFCYYNVGQANIQGLTLSGVQKFGPYEWHATLDSLDPINSVNGKTLSLRARQTMTLGVKRHMTSWQVSGELHAVSERFDDAANTINLPGYALLNIYASTHLAKDWRLVMRIDNASDTQYQQVGQYATPGRGLYAGVVWQPQ
jgi:vitamin B12 transporter